MTLKERTGWRDEYFSRWLRQAMPDSKTEGMLAMDCDWILGNYLTRKFIFLEVKNYCRKPTDTQRQLLKMLRESLTSRKLYDGWTCNGCYYLIFKAGDFADIVWFGEENNLRQVDEAMFKECLLRLLGYVV